MHGSNELPQSLIGSLMKILESKRSAPLSFMLKTDLRALIVGLFSSFVLGDLLSQDANWVTVHQSSWQGSPAGRVTLNYRKQFYTAAGEWNGNPLALWSNGASLWIAEWRFSKLFTYALPSFQRDSAKDFGNFIETGNRSARGLWSDGKTIWVSDDFQDKLFAYDLVSRERLPDMDVESLVDAGNESPTGLWSNGEIMWVADDGDDKIYAYRFGSWEHLPDRDINTLAAAGNTGLADIWSDGTTLWAAEVGSWTAWGGWSDGKLFAYDLATGARIPSKDFDNQSIQAPGLKSPNGIWSDGNSLWISDRPGHKVFVFDINTALSQAPAEASSDRDSTKDLRRLGYGGNARPTHLWSNHSILWVADNDDPLIYAYDLALRERKPDQDLSVALETENRNLNPAGIWSNGSIIWVVDWHTARVVAFDLQSHARLPGRDLNSLIDAGNHHPAGMWSDNETLWILDAEDARIYAYALSNGQRRSEADVSGLDQHGNKSPRGLWSDGATFWVGDWENEKIFAYQLEAGERVPEKDIDALVAAGNLSPSGFWSDGETLWVSDHADATVYSYPIATEMPLNTAPETDLEPFLRLDFSGPFYWTIEYSGVLKSASSLDGPFEPVAGALSPFRINTDREAQFYIVEPE